MGRKDICLKRYLSNEERFADLINGIMGEGERLVSATDLSDMDSQVGYHGWDRAAYRDLLKKVAYGVNFVVIGIENQEHTNYLMPLRCLCYDAKEYERQAAMEKSKIRRWKKMRKRIHTEEALKVPQTDESVPIEGLTREEFLSDFRKKSRLHPCITIVLYFGHDWDAATCLHELLDFSEIPEKLRPYVNDYQVFLVNVRRLQDTTVFQTDLRLVFDCIRFAENKERFCKNILDNEAYQQLDEDAYDVIARYTNVLGQKEITVDDKIEGGKVNMCKAMQELMADSKAAGRTEGRAEGRAEERRDVLIELLRGLGSLSDSLWERIRQECDLQVLRDWTRLAVRVDSVQEFEAKIQ